MAIFFMPRHTHVHHNKKHNSTSEEGFISDDFKKSMTKNEKIIMAALIGGILIFLVLSIIVLFARSQNTETTQFQPKTTVEKKLPTRPYPTIAPIENMTVMMNARRFSPSAFSIPRGGFVSFFNVTTDPISIEAGDGNSVMLNIGEIGSMEEKSVTFNTPGTYTFRNKDNTTQKGIITIK